MIRFLPSPYILLADEELPDDSAAAGREWLPTAYLQRGRGSHQLGRGSPSHHPAGRTQRLGRGFQDGFDGGVLTLPAKRHRCCRCGKSFIIYDDGQYQTVEDCLHHYGRLFKVKGQNRHRGHSLSISRPLRVRGGRGVAVQLLQREERLDRLPGGKGQLHLRPSAIQSMTYVSLSFT